VPVTQGDPDALAVVAVVNASGAWREGVVVFEGATRFNVTLRRPTTTNTGGGDGSNSATLEVGPAWRHSLHSRPMQLQELRT
jgi:hypothetical protein